MAEKQKKSIFKRWWFWVIIAVVVIAIASQGEDDTPKEASVDPAPIQSEDDRTDDVAKEDETEEEPVEEDVIEVVISGADLAQAFEDNEVKAEKEYTGKLAEITGEISDIGVALGQTYITLNTHEEFSLTSVQCFFKDEAEIDKLAEMNKGDTVTVIGEIGKKSLNVSVRNCKFK
jgi:hypothetical protein